MKKTIVYKITRVDGLEYVGITVNFKSRMYNHKKSNRFSMGIQHIETLAECDTYEEAERLEEHFIEKYNTYKGGLNTTQDGKGLNKDVKFNTLGFVFSDETRKKMSESAKKRGWHGVKKHSEETKKYYSLIRRGKPNFKSQKITDEEIDLIVDSYNKNSIVFDLDFIKKHVKASQREATNLDNIYQMSGKGGSPITPVTLYSYYYADMYNVTPVCIRGYILGTARRIKQTVKSVGAKRMG